MNSLLTSTGKSTSKAQEPSMGKSSADRPSRIGLSAAATLGYEQRPGERQADREDETLHAYPKDRHK